MSSSTTTVTVEKTVEQVTAAPAPPVAVTVAPAITQVSVETAGDVAVAVEQTPTTVQTQPAAAAAVSVSTVQTVVEITGGPGPAGPRGDTGPAGQAGPPGTGAVMMDETPAGSIDGSNLTFTLVNTPKMLALYLNGLRQRAGAGNDFTLSGKTIAYLAAPLAGDELLADYTY